MKGLDEVGHASVAKLAGGEAQALDARECAARAQLEANQRRAAGTQRAVRQVEHAQLRRCLPERPKKRGHKEARRGHRRVRHPQ